MEFDYNIQGENCNRHDLLLHINQAKNCCVSPNQGACKNFNIQQLGRSDLQTGKGLSAFSCCFPCNNQSPYPMPKGTYVGKKLFFEYTPESNCNWQWSRCNNIKPCPCAKKRDFMPDNGCACPKFSGYAVMD